MIFHTNDATRQDGLNEIFRVLKPGGTFLIVDTKTSAKEKGSESCGRVDGSCNVGKSVGKTPAHVRNRRFSIDSSR